MKLKEKIILAAILIAVVGLSRWIPHYPNFTALGAAALFAGSRFRKAYWAFIIPLLALFVSDLFLNNIIYAKAFPAAYDGFTLINPQSLWVYGAIIAVTVIGFSFLKKLSTGKILGSSVAGSLIFFLVTNFGTWMTGSLYPKSVEGLAACFTAAIPFFWNSLSGDLFYVAVFFGGYALVEELLPKPDPVRIQK